jgi:tRNA (guanine37-N1)-methyltransferase
VCYLLTVSCAAHKNASAHVNLNDEYLPYKHIIGQLILEVGLCLTNVARPLIPPQKNKKVKTVVNKLNSIDNQFRFFKMELIAGDADFVVEHVSNCPVE